ncbi:hypothetical protein ATJ93_4577 [Halopiger aswanensis]|uniref:Uncharacterized protein n=2 Tax=Halopiger aswanensis TaxID=148449 RepID=A0A419VWQ6_9EURY|nr:hypothetical protein ATJ93_4577 [Halopiger aswanensis]
MPINTDSDNWENGQRPDPLEVHIRKFLADNSEQAFFLDEIVDHVLENEANSLFLLEEIGGEVGEKTRDLVKTRVAAKLEELNWRQCITWRIVEQDDGGRRTYFSYSDDETISPLSAVHDEFPANFNSIERNLEHLSDDIEDLEYRMYEVEREQH